MDLKSRDHKRIRLTSSIGVRLAPSHPETTSLPSDDMCLATYMQTSTRRVCRDSRVAIKVGLRAKYDARLFIFVCF